MKSVFGIIVLGVVLTATSCNKIKMNEPEKTDEIVYQSLDLTLNGVSEEVVEIPFDERLEFTFSIMDIKAMNDDWDESNTDTLAAGLSVGYVQILDDSEYGYLNAMDRDVEINENAGNWNNRMDPADYILSTSWSGEFKGTGDKYLGFRLQREGGYIYGWFHVNCSEKSDQLEIKGYAYNKTVGNTILAGEK